MSLQYEGMPVTHVTKRVSKTRRRTISVATVIVGDGLLRPIPPLDGVTPVSFSDVLYDRYRQPVEVATAPKRSAAKPNGDATRARTAMVYGCCGGHRGRHRDNCEQGIDDWRRHRKTDRRPRL